MMRLFVGLGLPPDTRDALCSAVSGLRIRGQMTLKENYHLTLAFLGEHDEWLKPLQGVITAAVQTCAPLILTVAGFGVFGRRENALLHAKLAFSQPLQALCYTVRTLLAEAGETYDDKPFTAHITLARKADVTAINWQTQITPISFSVNHLTLYHSARVQGVLRYKPVFGAPLGKDEVQA